jgi:hypothetical protein
MNNCPECGHDLVNVIYGFPTPKLIDMARSEGIALGGCTVGKDMPTHYCYGCQESYPRVDDAGDYEEVSLFSDTK